MKVSVVMAVHNGGSFLQVQLSSILENTTPPDELIIVDDASTDDSVTVIKYHQREWPMIELVRNDRNIGPTRSFYKGVAASTGDIILFSDQDDQWSSEKISTMVNVFLRSPTTVMVYSDGTITDASLRPTSRTIFNTRKREDLHLGASREPRSVATDPDIKGCTMAVSGTFIRDLLSVKDPDPAPFWGHDHWVALFAYGLGKVEVLEMPLIMHRFHGKNSSAGVEFNPWSPAHWGKWLRLATNRDHDHDSRKYRIALHHAERYGPAFSTQLYNELERLANISDRREKIGELSFFKRFRPAFAMHQEGIYREYFNGIWTCARDIVLR